jgi:hypothetical protein
MQLFRKRNIGHKWGFRRSPDLSFFFFVEITIGMQIQPIGSGDSGPYIKYILPPSMPSSLSSLSFFALCTSLEFYPFKPY